jgi:hypothetical protein
MSLAEIDCHPGWVLQFSRYSIPPMTDRVTSLPAPLVALLGWLVPGAGYWVIGERARAVIICIAIVLIYFLGLLIGGVRVIEVPGYDRQTGEQVRVSGSRRVNPNERDYPYARWILADRPLAEIADKPWFAAQILAGPIALISAAASNHFANVPRPHAPLDNIGTLYAAVAGMLNLFVIIDSTFRSNQPARQTRVAA